MPIHHGSRRDQLVQLRNWVDAEIRAIDRRLALGIPEPQPAARRRSGLVVTVPYPKPPTRLELADLERRAPTRLVRLWAREQGLNVGMRGSISIDVRRAYLNAMRQTDLTATQAAHQFPTTLQEATG